MIRHLRNWIDRLADMGTLPSDTEKEKLHKRFLIYVALMMNGGGLLWATICIYYGLYLPAAVPLSYVVLTVANLSLFSRTKRFGLARSFQLLISLVLPFVFQWSLGGFVPSGSVMLWAMTAILGALTFQEIKITLRWYLGYLALTVLTGVIDGNISTFTTPGSSTPEATLFVVNIIGVSIIVFGLMIYFVRSNDLAYEELEQKNTELVESQAQLVQAEKMASIGSLTAGIAHEMNTPVGVINSNTDVSRRCIAVITEGLERCRTLDELGSNDRFQRSLEQLRANNKVTLDSSARITKLVNSLRSFTRLDEAKFQKADLHEGLESALNLVGYDLKDRIDIVREYGDIPAIVCHPGGLNQVFMNILRNAVEAIEDSGKITIRSFVGKDDVRIQIEDTGVGIAPEQLHRIFDPTFTRRGPRVRAGLGLFASYQIVQKHNGEITIESERGSGTVVTVILPPTQEDPPTLNVQQM
jgi:signal transduction histidine kinase